jgi:hypothetical protein
MPTSPKFDPATLVVSQAEPPTSRYVDAHAEGTGTGCSVCSAVVDYVYQTGVITIALLSAPEALEVMFLDQDVRYAPTPADLSDLVRNKSARWKLPTVPGPLSLVIDGGFLRNGIMVASKRPIVASDQRDLDAAE